MYKNEKPTILIVDDDDSSRLILTSIFESKYTIIEAVNGEFALSMIKKGICPDLVILDLNMPILDGYSVLAELSSSQEFRRIPIIVSTSDSSNEARRKAYSLGAIDVLLKPYQADTIRYRVQNILRSIHENSTFVASAVRDEFLSYDHADITGLWGRQRFIEEATNFLANHPDGEYVIARWDINQFKLFNDNFGIAAGDELLREIGRRIIKASALIKDWAAELYGHWGADHFIFLYDAKKLKPEPLYRFTLQQLHDAHSDFDFTIGFGFYKIENREMSVATMSDRAELARRSIKNLYNTHYAWYHESMHKQLVEEQKLTSAMKPALLNKEFIPYFQPQYNYETQAIIGAESLIRWKTATGELISPAVFIPLFEKNGFISEVDYYMWDTTCSYIRKWRDAGYLVPPISVNISRRDFYDVNLVSKICALIDKYELTPSCLHLEITESAYMDNPDQLLSVVAKLRDKGFHVEMDDFGSGYSSLNTLKDVLVDTLKLDMKFIADSSDSGRGGSILSSVVHMAHALYLPVIAEGVESKQQADYLKTINCLQMQGYLFAKPMPPEDFEKLLAHRVTDETGGFVFENVVDNAAEFLDGSAQATLLFNSFVGGAAILEAENDKLTAIRVNDRLYEEICIPRSLFVHSSTSFIDFLDQGSKTALLDAVHLAVSSNSESSCEIHFPDINHRIKEQWLFVRLRYLARKLNCHVLYANVSNVTPRKLLEKALFKEKLGLEQILRFVPGGIAEFVATSDDSLKRIYLSEAANRILGYDVSGIKPTSNLMSQLRRIHKDDRSEVRDKIKKAITNKESFSTDFRIEIGDGAIKWINLSATPSVIDGELHFYGIYTDISLIKVAEANKLTNFNNNTLNESVKETVFYGSWMRYLQNCTDKIFIKDINSIYLAASKGFVEMTGHNSYRDIIGKNDYEVFKDQNVAAHFIKTDLDLLTTGQDKLDFIENATDPKNGQEHLVVTSKYVLRDSEEKVIGLLGVSKDISSNQVKEEYHVALEASSKNIFRYKVAGRVFFDIENSEGKIAPISIANAPATLLEQGRIDKSCANEWLNMFEQIDRGTPVGSSDIIFTNSQGEQNLYQVNFRTIFDDAQMPISAIITYKIVNSSSSSILKDKMIKHVAFNALTKLYPFFAAVNISRNEAQVYRSIENTLPNDLFDNGYMAAIEAISEKCAGKDQKRFLSTFSRENIYKNFKNNKTDIHNLFDIHSNDGQYHEMEFKIIELKDSESDDIVAAFLARQTS